jgi:hypothetical protein
MSSRGIFIVGLIGMLLLIIIVPVMLLTRFIPFYVPIFFTAMLVVLLAAIVLGSFAFFGFYRNYGSLMGFATFVVSLIFPWFSLAADYLHGYSGLAVIFTPYHAPGPLFHFWLFTWILGDFLIGVLFLLWGFSFIAVRKSIGNSKLAIAVGVLFILGGSFWLTFLLRLYGGVFYLAFSSIFLIPAGILGLVSLFTADTSS